MLDSIYKMTLKYFKIALFGVKVLDFLSVCTKRSYIRQSSKLLNIMSILIDATPCDKFDAVYFQ